METLKTFSAWPFYIGVSELMFLKKIGKIYWDPNFKLVLHLVQVHGPLSVFFKVLAFIVWNMILVLHKLRSQRCFYTQSAQAWKIYALSIQLVYIQFMLLFSFVGPTVHNFFLAYFFHRAHNGAKETCELI